MRWRGDEDWKDGLSGGADGETAEFVAGGDLEGASSRAIPKSQIFTETSYVETEENGDFVQKDVGRLDVAMNDPSGVHVQETAQDLIGDVTHVVDFKELIACYYFVHIRFYEIHDNVTR